MEKLIELIKAGYGIEFKEAFGFNQVEITLTKFKKDVKFKQSQIIPMDHHLDKIPDVLTFCENKLEEGIKLYFKPTKK